MSDEEVSAVPPPAGLVVQSFVSNGARLALLSFPIGDATSESPGGVPGIELTAVEVDLLRELLNGSTNAAIASARGTSVKTVSNQVSALLAKCGAASRGDLAARWLELLTPRVR